MTARRRRPCVSGPRRFKPCFHRSPRADDGKPLNEKSTMRRLKRLIAASVLVALSGAIAGCSSSVNSFDPMDWLDWLDTKKKLQGDRKPVFPEGVPGLEQGVPKSLYKGAQQEADQNAQTAAAVVPPPPPAETKPKRTARPKSKPQSDTASSDPSAAPQEDATAAAPPAPKKKIVRQRTTAPPPDQPAAAPPQPAPATQPTQQSAAPPFPAPLPGGTFTR